MNFQGIHDRVRRRQTPLLRLALGLTVMAFFIGFTGLAAEKGKNKTTDKTAEHDKDKLVTVEPMSIEEMKQAIRNHLFKKTQKAASGASKPDNTPWI